MKKLVAAVLTLIFAQASVAFASDIGELTWSGPDLQALRALDKGDVARFVNQNGGAKFETKPADIGDFTWADLEGNGHYDLVTIQDVSRRFFNALVIYRRDRSGKVSSQEIRGWMIGRLTSVVRDLDHDGRDELVIPTLFPPGAYGAGVVSARWPAIYRLNDGRYVEASNRFASFYDAEVLPRLNNDIAKSRGKIAEGFRYQHTLAAQTLEKDKILRVLGREPRAGLAEAREWISGDDLRLASVGIAVLQDIGGYEDEVRTARDALKRATEREHARPAESNR